jgi:hypothetical protein
MGEKRRSSWDIRDDIDQMVIEYESHAPDDDEDWEEAWWMSWNHLASERNDKVLACRFTKERAEMEAERARQMARRWQDRARRMKGLTDRMKEVSVALMTDMGDTKLDLPDGSRATLVVKVGHDLEGDLDVDRLPLRFVKREIARGDLKLALKKGEVIEGVALREKAVRYIRWSI